MNQQLPQIKCLLQALTEFTIPYSIHDKNGNFIELGLTQKYFFINSGTPFNNEGISKICQDKEFSYLLLKDTLRTPKTMGFFDPYHRDEYRQYIIHKSYEEITDDIERNFSYPLIIKMNSGSQGKNVYLVKDRHESLVALTKIFDHADALYDYIALAQEYISSQREFRVIICDQEIVLLYEKECSNSTFVGNLSPLHRENSRAVHISDEKLIKRIKNFIKPMYSKVPIRFGGLDVIEDTWGNLHLLELNSRPGFSYFLRDNNERLLIKMYKKLLNSLLNLPK